MLMQAIKFKKKLNDVEGATTTEESKETTKKKRKKKGKHNENCQQQ